MVNQIINVREKNNAEKYTGYCLISGVLGVISLASFWGWLFYKLNNYPLAPATNFEKILFFASFYLMIGLGTFSLAFAYLARKENKKMNWDIKLLIGIILGIISIVGYFIFFAWPFL